MAHQGDWPLKLSTLSRRNADVTYAYIRPDVVPVNPATVDQWTHKPYDAHMDKRGWIWGVSGCRSQSEGSIDVRNEADYVSASLSSVEWPIARTR